MKMTMAMKNLTIVDKENMLNMINMMMMDMMPINLNLMENKQHMIIITVQNTQVMITKKTTNTDTKMTTNKTTKKMSIK